MSLLRLLSIACSATIILYSNLHAAETAPPSQASICSGCHGLDGIGLSYEYPNLAGQKREYLVKQLNAFKSKDRKDPTMNAMAAALSDDDIDIITRYYSELSTPKIDPKADPKDTPKKD